MSSLLNWLRVFYWSMRLRWTVGRYGMENFRKALLRCGWEEDRDILVRDGLRVTNYSKGTSHFTLTEEYEIESNG